MGADSRDPRKNKPRYVILGILEFFMYVWLNLVTIKFYLIKLATYFYWKPSYLLGVRSSLLVGLLKRPLWVFKLFWSKSFLKSTHFLSNKIFLVLLKFRLPQKVWVNLFRKGFMTSTQGLLATVTQNIINDNDKLKPTRQNLGLVFHKAENSAQTTLRVPSH